MSVQPNEVVLSFTSHRSRQRSGVAMDRRCKAVYSLSRASHGGFYRTDKETADIYLHNPISGERRKGVNILRPPYTDIMDCWSGD